MLPKQENHSKGNQPPEVMDKKCGGFIHQSFIVTNIEYNFSDLNVKTMNFTHYIKFKLIISIKST